MKKLDLYLIKKFMGPFLVVFFIVVFALSLQFIWQYINDLAGKGLSIGVIFEFWGWASCTLLPNEIPLATLLASIMTLGGLGERNELLAMKAAGISLMRIMLPLVVISTLITVGAFFVADRLVPYAFNKVYTLKQDITRTRDEIKIPTGIFYDGIDGYILRVADRNEETQMMYDLIIYDHTSNMGNTNMTVADSGRIEITPDKENLIFNLYDGCSYTETNTMNFRDTTLELSRLRFNEQQLIIQLDNYRFQRSEQDNYGDELKSLGIKRLRHDRDSISRQLDTMVRRQLPRFASTVGLNYLYQLDTLLGKDKTYLGDLNVDSIRVSLTPQELQRVRRSAAGKAETGEEQVKNFERESSYNVSMIRRIDVESIIKFTLSLSCLIFFFVGAPLGAIIRKGGFGTPVVISILLYLIYYIIDIIGRKLATRSGTLTPWEGALISTLVLLPMAILLTRKSTQDSSLFNPDAYKEFFRRIGKWIAKRYHRFINLFRQGGGKIRIVYMGTPEFAVAPLEKLIQAGYEIVGVVTAVDKPSGRGLTMNESAVKKYAVAHNLPVLQPEKLKDPAFLEQLAALKANLFVVVAFRMLPKEVWQMPALGTFNLHASLLPQYRGAAPINWAIINGEKFSGVTTFLLDEQIDTGKILFQESCAIEEYEDAGALHDKLMGMGADLVLKTVDAIENHRTKPFEQTLGLNKTLRNAPKLTRDNCHIDWTRSARTTQLLIRGLSPYPAAWTNLVKEDGTQVGVKIFDSYVVPCDETDPRPVGSITTDHKTYLEVRCGKDALRILNLQLAGKKRMDIGAFLLGFREPERARFE
ncbi:MAG: methionyl-tRNA formyltransferase [Bacteroidales bacterium]|nr:methionyl-tRNA formyltransferase [Bacteroidales bacterium]